MTTVEPPCDADSARPDSAAAARIRVRGLLAGHRAPPDGGLPLEDRVVTDVLLVTSELVTNAIRHGGGVTGFAATVEDGFVCLVVSDASSARPTRSPAEPGRPGGYGWPLVCLVADEVTVTPHPGGGKSISVRMRLA
ncbi:ATP-binding protein [Actinacidiphila sp. ITFR-21]|uniref:ATP-binding protein n=1 Tax=Actinacidiphila sp. ITFR-21 TaxID=3075199 RepID=UPI00288A9EAD|nr:ATP-binding protein [Streptomyces sp. ITFR-21]WNI14461.1 ATP-binding protein [Streptomyces sp. ITFR-21]